MQKIVTLGFKKLAIISLLIALTVSIVLTGRIEEKKPIEIIDIEASEHVSGNEAKV